MSRTFGLPGAQPAIPPNTGDMISIAASAAINNLTAFTYAAWIFWNGTNPDNFYVITVKDSANTASPFLVVEDLGPGFEQNITTQIRNTVTFFNSQSSAFTLTPNVWHRTAMTYDDAGDRKMHIYIDGVEPTYAVQDTVTGVLADNSGGGQLVGNDTFGDTFQGYIGEFKIWNVALTSGQIASDFAGIPVLPANNVVWLQLCGRSNPELDKSGNGNTGLVTGAPIGPDTPFGQCTFLAEENGFVPMSTISSKTKATVFGG